MTQQKRPSTPFKFWHSPSASLGLFATLCLTVAYFSKSRPGLVTWMWACPVKSTLDLPCFTCGITRVFLHLSRGEVVDAVVLAPLPFIIVVASLVFGLSWVVSFWRPSKSADRWFFAKLHKTKRWFPLALMALLLWGYAIGRSLQTHAP